MSNFVVLGAGRQRRVGLPWWRLDGADHWNAEAGERIRFEGGEMATIADRPLDVELTEGEEFIVRDPSAAVGSREHRVQSVQGSFHVTQSSHGLAQGDAIGRSGGAWVAADADGSIPALGVVVSVLDANSFLAATSSFKLTWTSHGLGAEGQRYLSATAGGHATSPGGPGSISQRTLYVLDANTVLIDLGEPLT